jgi:outer membrane immunogenic protein
MKKIALSIAAVMAISGSVMAGGDLETGIVTPMPMDNWSGFYVGAELGYIWGDADTSYNDGSTNLTQNVDGFAGGFYGGYNWLTSGNVLFGVEADLNLVGGDDTGFNSAAHEVRLENNWEGSIRLRSGMVVGDVWMPYLTGGFAWTDLDVDYGQSGQALSHDSGTMTGWTLGAGAEYRFSEHVHLKFEYRYTDYGDFSENFKGMKTDYSTNKVYSGVSYRF